jgi:hypothetical protein
MANTYVSLVGKDTIKVNGYILFDLADGDIATLTFPNELMAVKTGKNGNSLYAFNETGRQCELVVRVIRGGPSDKYLDSVMQQMIKDPPSFILMNAQITKRIGDGRGSVGSDTYVLDGGVIYKQVETKVNVEGDTAQSLSEYHMKFTNSNRRIN